MAFLVSPGVQVIETDLTNVVPAVSASIGAISGGFSWGPVGEIRTVSSEKELVRWFGQPDSTTFKWFMPAAQFLQYGNALKVVRALNAGMQNAVTGGSTLTVRNREEYDSTTFGATEFFAAKYPGVRGNALEVHICPAGATFSSWEYAGNFEAAPGTSDFAADVGGANDEMHIVIIDGDGTITGRAGEILETFGFVSQASDARAEDGTNNYFKDVLANSSEWIWSGALDTTTFTNIGSAAAGVTFTDQGAIKDDYILSAGASTNAPTVGEIDTANEKFADAETEDVSLILGGWTPSGTDGTTHVNNVIAIAAARRDCIALVSPPIDATVGNSDPIGSNSGIISFMGGTGDYSTAITRTSYGVMDSTALYVYDKYNDVYRWIVGNGATAGLCANADNVADAWFSPAGFSRGQILGVTKLAFNPKKAARDTLYLNQVNPVVSFPGQGTVLYGDKTLQAKPSAFDRINVRRLFILLEKAISTAAKYQLFEFNDEFTRAQFRNMVEPFLRDVQGRRGVTDFAVICDETNNTGDIIDSNRFVADIYVKPSRSINFITLNFVATRTGVEFSEITGK